MKHSLDIKEISYFVKVAELQNITSAAEELYITQPSLSRHLLKLETDLQIQLFNRSKTGVTLTEKGARFYQYCLELLDSYERFTVKTSALRGSVIGKLKIGYQKSNGDTLLDINNAFLKQYSEVNLDIYRQGDKNLLAMLLNQELDFIFNNGDEYKAENTAIETLKIKTLPNVVVMRSDNPLAQKDKVHFTELKDQPFILPMRVSQPGKLDTILEYCRMYGFSPKYVRSEFQFTNILIDIVSYNAVFISPLIPSIERESNSKVKFVPLEGYKPEHTIVMAWLRKNENPLIRPYIREVRKYIAENS